ncbi:UPF0158 family protein [Maledivibacter halophilus]|uniref:Uncharacterized protein family (UPF0158) n=1 Tax=Maledivibacter halophilus TaxID=36842 RepID=A0A1T5KQV8_9FIRM|nr:UPF0158 family protein [Maledivibacter halophilus]SKC66142.1 Uncharacterised protein family (UPF0158) [Maledivibacter halophilus]
MKPINLNELSEQLDCLFDEWLYYLNINTGKIVEIQIEYFNIAEELDENYDISGYLNWEQDEIKTAIDIFENWDNYISLPNKFYIDEYSIMEEFSYSYHDKKVSDKLCSAIRGRGAFRRFKDTIICFGIDDEWYAYKKAKLIEIARNWCEINQIPYSN